MFDEVHLRELYKISNNLTRENIGDSMAHAVVFRSLIVDPRNKDIADRMMNVIRAFARDVDIVGWVIFEEPIELKHELTEINIWQLIGIVGVLMDLNYCFERIEEAAIFTFENSTPVRFYINGIFHYVTALFLLDKGKNLEKGLPRPGTVIKVLHPIGLSDLLDPIYEIFERPLGEENSYGETIRKNRNRQFVHGSFSPENIRDLVRDTNIFDERQKLRFLQCHYDLNDQLIILRLKLLSILNHQEIDMADFSPSRIYHF